MKSIALLVGRFGIVGVLCTITAYAVFVTAAGYVHYIIANVFGWLSATGLGFTLNRSFTFGISGAEHIRRDAALFAAGSLGQLAIASLGYWLLIGVLGVPPILAFPINLGFTMPPMFLFLRFVAFRRGHSARG